jgi:predicted DNA-binding WGR domain protein/Leucine-rich repeat (LRR) protein
MKKHLTFKDDKSDKFWSIEVNGKSFTVTYGKTGTDGQTSVKDFDSEEKCMKEAEKLTGEKVKKGYGENDSVLSSPSVTAPDYLKEWEEIVNAKDKKKALYNHFNFMADTPGFDIILKKALKKVDSVKIEEGNLVLNFEDKQLIAQPPANDLTTYAQWPQSFQKVMMKHERLLFPEEGWAVVLDGEDNFRIEKGEAGYQMPCRDYSDWWVYHPTEKNTSGEPLLYYLSHEGGKPGDHGISYLNIGSLFLRKIAGEILEEEEDEIEFPEGFVLTKENEWTKIYNQFSPAWKKYLKEKFSITENKKHESIANITTLHIKEGDKIKTLREATFFPNVTKLDIECIVSDPESLVTMTEINTLSISHWPVADLQNISGCSKLENLYLKNILDLKTKITGLSTLFTKITKLQDLTINDSQLVEAPHGVDALINLRSLSLSENNLSIMPGNLSNLLSLEELVLDNNNITSFSSVFNKNVKKLSLKTNAIKSLPDEIIAWKNVEDLTLDKNDLEDLPEVMHEFSSLSSLDISRNALKHFPSVLEKLPNLQRLNVLNNKIESIPDFIWELKLLRCIYFAGNRMTMSAASKIRNDMNNKIEILNSQGGKLDPEVDEILNKIEGDFNNNRYIEVIVPCEKLLAIDPDFPQGLMYLGLARFFTNDRTMAITILKRAAEQGNESLNNKIVQDLYEWAWARTKEDTEYVTEVILNTLKIRHRWPYKIQGQNLLKAGETAEAIALLETALEIDPSYSDAHELLKKAREMTS